MLFAEQKSLTYKFTDTSAWETAEHFAIGLTDGAEGNFIQIRFNDKIHGFEHAIFLAQNLSRRYDFSLTKPTSVDPSAVLTINGKKQGGRLSSADVDYVLKLMQEINIIEPQSRSQAAQQLALLPN